VEGAGSQDRQPSLQLGLLIHSTIVGAVVEEVLQNDTDWAARVLFTPAYIIDAKGFETFARSRGDAVRAVAREGDGLE
jgi:hypothetical protein